MPVRVEIATTRYDGENRPWPAGVCPWGHPHREGRASAVL